MIVKLSFRERLEVRIMVDRSLPMPSVDELRLPELVKAIADQNRLRIVMSLADGEFHTTETLPGLDVQKSTVSHHLRTLREAGFTETQFTGRTCAIRLRVADLDARFPGFVDALTSPAAIADVADRVAT
jgi:DNA-binding transcriptional ArsR family regulator